MTWAVFLFTVLKIGVALVFLLTGAAVCTWADRRQSSMIQDRVGPNRAVAFVPSHPLRGVVFLLSAAVAAPFGIFFWWRAPGVELARITTGVEVAIGVTWFSLLLLSAHVRKYGAENALDRAVAAVEPRMYFYGGLVLHLAALPLVRFIPSTMYRTAGIQWLPGMAGELAAIAIMSAGFYLAAKLPDGKTALRFAGLMHVMADAMKMIWKEDLRPKNVDKVLFSMAPILAIVPALVTMAVVPMGSTLCFKDTDKDGLLGFGDLGSMADTAAASGSCSAGEVSLGLQIADLNVGLLFIFAIAGTGVIGAAIAGWSSDSKFALLGGLRATGQMVSYEVAAGLSIVGLLMVASTVHVQQLVDWQGENTWGIFAQPLGFLLFFTALVAETKRVPFDLPEGEAEIVAGYHIEYSGMKFGMFFLGEYIEFVFASALMVTLFFGGYHLPFLHADGMRIEFGANILYEMKMSHMAVSVIHVLAFFGKVALFTWLHVFIRWTLPRFRYDQLMKLGWLKLLPLALVNIMLTGLVLLALDSGGEGVQAVFKMAADISQALIAVVALVAAVAAVTWLLEPPKPCSTVASTAARFVAATGGVKAKKMQA